MANKPQIGLIKTCQSCGQQKPLSAFLQLSDSGSSMYGNICAACRKTEKERAKKLGVDEGSGSNTTGHNIDANAKIEMEKEAKAQHEQIEALYEQEEEKEQLTEEQRIAKIQDIATKEQEHREGYLNRPSTDESKNIPGKVLSSRAFFGEERLKKDADLTKHAHVSGQIKHSSVHLLAFKQWVGPNATIVGNIEKMGLDKTTPDTTGPRKKK